MISFHCFYSVWGGWLDSFVDLCLACSLGCQLSLADLDWPVWGDMWRSILIICLYSICRLTDAYFYDYIRDMKTQTSVFTNLTYIMSFTISFAKGNDSHAQNQRVKKKSTLKKYY